jgi:hypothetical protein
LAALLNRFMPPLMCMCCLPSLPALPSGLASTEHRSAPVGAQAQSQACAPEPQSIAWHQHLYQHLYLSVYTPRWRANLSGAASSSAELPAQATRPFSSTTARSV